MPDVWDCVFVGIASENRTMLKLAWGSKLFLALALAGTAGVAAAQSLPVTVEASGNHAHASISLDDVEVAELILDFQDASNLGASSLGVSAEVVNPLDPALLARLPDANLTMLTTGLPVMITIEPPANGGLSFRNTGRLEIHTHALPYAIGSSLRVFKAPLGGNFRDVTDEIAEGSVRARSTYGGFSQFLILTDVRTTGTVVNEKISWLRDKVSTLPLSERGAFNAKLDDVQAAVALGNYAAALAAIDAFSSRAQARAGQFIANEWRATRDVDNQAGNLVAGAATLRFSVAYLRDFGQ
jgi:uncharacterized protein DUF6689